MLRTALFMRSTTAVQASHLTEISMFSRAPLQMLAALAFCCDTAQWWKEIAARIL
jgi:hypothetical protein